MGIFFRDDDDNDEEEYTGPTGDPLHDDIYGWNMGSGSADDDDGGRRTGGDFPDLRIREYENKAWDLYMDFKEEEALRYINMALDLDGRNANNWNRKAIILEGMKRYAESEECYNRSLELLAQNLVYDNKARMLYDWAVHLREESKKLPNGLDLLNDANDKLTKAMRALPGENSEEDLDKYLWLRDSINFYIDYEKKFQRNLEVLKKYDKSELFTITGMHFYPNDVVLKPDMPLRLVKEPDNEFDKDAIAVYAQDEKIGYVANNDYTKYELTSSALQLQDKIDDVAQGIYLFFFRQVCGDTVSYRKDSQMKICVFN